MSTQTLEAASKAAAELAETFGLAPGVKAENVSRRVVALIANGTDSITARALAMEAESTQVARDAQTAAERKKAEKAAPLTIGEQLPAMTVADLLAFAATEKITIGEGIKLKADILAAIQAALAARG